MKKLLFLILVFSGCIKTDAANYYFAANGDDSRTSTQARDSTTPWKTTAKLNSFFGSMQPGDKALFRKGDIFSGGIITNRNGTALLPITIGAYGSGALPIISGFTTATGWTDIGGNVSESSALTGIPSGKRTWMVTIDGVPYAMGRYPNISSGNTGYLNYESHTSTSITDNQSTFSTDWAGAEIVLRTSRWIHDKGAITSTNGANTINFSTSGFNTQVTIDGYGFFLQNSSKTLDQFGEWYYNPSTQKIRMYFGGNTPLGYLVQVSKTDTLMQIRHSFITVRDLSFQGGNYGIWNNWSGVNDIKVINCSFVKNGVDGIYLAGKTNVTVDSCFLYGNNNNGIIFGIHNINCVVSNTKIVNTGLFQGMTSPDEAGRNSYGLFCQTALNVKGLRAVNDSVMNTGYMGIFVEGDSFMVKNSFVDSSCLTLDDGAGIYTGNFTANGQQPASNRGDTIMNNVVLHSIGAPNGTNASDSLAHGYYTDDNTNHTVLMNNTAAYNAFSGVYIHNSDSNVYRNNVFFDNHNTQIYFQDDALGDTIMGNDLKQNKLLALNSSQLLYRLASANNNFRTFATIDSNYESQPFNTIMAYRNWFGQGSGCCSYYTQAQWQSSGAYSFDLHSKGLPVSVSNPYNIVMQAAGSQALPLPFSCVVFYNIDGTIYTDGVTVPPNTSVILVKP